MHAAEATFVTLHTRARPRPVTRTTRKACATLPDVSGLAAPAPLAVEVGLLSQTVPRQLSQVRHRFACGTLRAQNACHRLVSRITRQLAQPPLISDARLAMEFVHLRAARLALARAQIQPRLRQLMVWQGHTASFLVALACRQLAPASAELVPLPSAQLQVLLDLAGQVPTIFAYRTAL